MSNGRTMAPGKAAWRVSSGCNQPCGHQGLHLVAMETYKNGKVTVTTSRDV